jgi:hypothetical protein
VSFSVENSQHPRPPHPENAVHREPAESACHGINETSSSFLFISRSGDMTTRQVLMRDTGKRSMVTLCIGGGQGIALTLEMM